MNWLSTLAPEGVLLLGDAPDDLQWLEARLRHLDVDVCTAVDRDQCHRHLQHRQWSAIVIAARDKASVKWAQSILSSAPTDEASLPPCGLILQEGCPNSLPSPYLASFSLVSRSLETPQELREFLRHLLDHSVFQDVSVLLVDDGDLPTTLWPSLERLETRHLRRVSHAEVAQALRFERPDLILSATTTASEWPLLLGHRLRSSMDHRWIPWVALHQGPHDYGQRLLEAGVDRCLSLYTPPRQLRLHLRQLLGRWTALRRRSARDDLTGLWTRRAFAEQLRARLSEARRHERRLAVAMLDLDRFKRVNDRHGHAMGDRVLQTLANLLTDHLRQEDLCARWGGEEFLIALGDQSLTEATRALHRLRRQFASLRFSLDHSSPFQVTFSAGVAVFPDDGEAMADLIATADARLMSAKRAGRNTVHASLSPNSSAALDVSTH